MEMFCVGTSADCEDVSTASSAEVFDMTKNVPSKDIKKSPYSNCLCVISGSTYVCLVYNTRATYSRVSRYVSLIALRV